MYSRGASHAYRVLIAVLTAVLAGFRYIGLLAEWSKATVLKTASPKGDEGSNPSQPAIFTEGRQSRLRCTGLLNQRPETVERVRISRLPPLLAVALLCLPLAACSAKITIDQPDGSRVRMSEALYAHQLSTEAFVKRSTAQASCFDAAGAISRAQPSTNDLNGPLMLSTCMQGGGQQQAQVPQYVAPPSFLDRVVQLAPAVIGVGQVIAADRASERATQAQLGLARINADERAATMGAFVGVSQAGYNALGATAQAGFGAVERTASSGYSALSSTAGSGFSAISTLGTHAIDASAQATGAWSAAIAGMPPTYQLGDGSMIVTGNDNTSQTGSGSIDQSQVGRDRDVTRNCTATSTASASGSSAGTASGTTGPFAQGGALGFYPQSPATIECGG